MTREEILQTFSDINHAYNNSTKYDTLKRMLDELTEPCEDCISRKAVMKCFKKWQPYMATRIYEYEQELKALPSVQPKPKTGHWIKSSNGMFAECSDCGKHGEYGLLKQYKYCPNCGAKMESEDKE